MLVKGDLENDRREQDKIFFEIAKNGHYIPVIDKGGNIIFTPEQYRDMRETFEGLSKYEGPELDIIPAEKDSVHANEINALAKKLIKDGEKVSELSNSIRDEVRTVLQEMNIDLKSEFDTGLLGAELYDAGSTGRGTNAPGSYDYDLILKLDDSEFDKAKSIIDDLKSRFKPKKVEEYGEGHYQLRAYGCTGISDTPIDIDVGIVKKSELAVYGSHDAVSDKLESIRKNNGQEVYEQTVANIVLTKQVLKDGQAYKKIEHGGMGGIGVENWVLLHGGNMVEAFNSFKSAAFVDDRRLPLDDFKKRYKVLDAGVNVQKLSHDNYIEKLTEQGYQAMLDTIDGYINREE